jgi:hypothetical protein
MIFYLTFPQSSIMKDGWFEVIADNFDLAEHAASKEFGTQRATLYVEQKFERSYFPKGKLGEINQLAPIEDLREHEGLMLQAKLKWHRLGMDSPKTPIENAMVELKAIIDEKSKLMAKTIENQTMQLQYSIAQQTDQIKNSIAEAYDRMKGPKIMTRDNLFLENTSDCPLTISDIGMTKIVSLEVGQEITLPAGRYRVTGRLADGKEFSFEIGI